MYCEKCGSQIPDDAIFCPKCGFKLKSESGNSNGSSELAVNADSRPLVAAADAQVLKCPSCGAPLKPALGEMIITCEYCGASITLNTDGWRNIQKHTMLPLSYATEDSVLTLIKGYLDRGLLRRHLEEESKNEGISLAFIPYWIVPVSARTQFTYVSAAAEAGSLAGTALLMGLMGGAMGGRGGRGLGMGVGMLDGMMVGGMVMGGGMGGRGNVRAGNLDQSYNFPVVAVKGLLMYQPRDYTFDLQARVLFDVSKIPKGINVLNGDVSEDAAKYQAKTYVDQLQNEKVHQQYHMVQKITTVDDVADPELLHVPVWFAKFSHKGKEISLILDGSNGKIINSVGLS
ncbi:MAG TPA: zinc ribbon domain-containing protein [Thermoplasmataceae archaeon]|nr:zinc ribbon domain-containing protein [Thermoplasmatales archaeon AK]HLH86703.1 zinc ribbon domain-containing protein [Thermoplasmataceae archaeon]